MRAFNWILYEHTWQECHFRFRFLFSINKPFLIQKWRIKKMVAVSRRFYVSLDDTVEHNVLKTRMHSSRMRTGRSLTVCWSVLPGGVWSGGCLLRGGLLWGGLPAWGGGFSLPGGVLPARGGGVLPAWRPPPVNRITHTCKNITLATTSLRPVINRAKLVPMFYRKNVSCCINWSGPESSLSRPHWPNYPGSATAVRTFLVLIESIIAI